MQQHSTAYTIGFAAAVCGVCSIFVAGSAVALKPRQIDNRILDRQANVLSVAGLLEGDPSAQEIRGLYEKYIEPVVVDMGSGEAQPSIDPLNFDQQAAMKDPATSVAAPPNAAKVPRLPKSGLVFKVMKENKLEAVIFPVQGKGLWSTLYGYLALDADGNTIKGITFYEHGETPGLGGEIDNPRWQALWPGRKAYGETGKPVIQVVKGQVGPPSEDPHKVDGLSGATITSRGVSDLVQFWLGENGYGPYVERLRSGKEAS